MRDTLLGEIPGYPMLFILARGPARNKLGIYLDLRLHGLGGFDRLNHEVDGELSHPFLLDMDGGQPGETIRASEILSNPTTDTSSGIR